MNSNYVPMACGTALVFMAGAASHHWISTREVASAPPHKLTIVSAAKAPSDTSNTEERLFRRLAEILDQNEKRHERSGYPDPFMLLADCNSNQVRPLYYNSEFRPLKVEE